MSREHARRSLNWGAACENTPPANTAAASATANEWKVRNPPADNQVNTKQLKVVLTRTDDGLKNVLPKSPRRKVLEQKQISELLDLDSDEQSDNEDDDNESGRGSPVYDLQEAAKVFKLKESAKKKPASQRSDSLSGDEDEEVTFIKLVHRQTTPGKTTGIVKPLPKSAAKIIPLKTDGKKTPLKAAKENTPVKTGGKSTTAKPASAVKTPITPRISKKDATPSTPRGAVKRLSLDPQAARMMTPKSNKRTSLAPKRYYPDERSEDDFETTKSLIKKVVLQSAKKAKIENENEEICSKKTADQNTRTVRRASSAKKTIVEESFSSPDKKSIYKGRESDDSDFEVSNKCVRKTIPTSRPRRASIQIMSPCVKQSGSVKKVVPKKKAKKIESESGEDSEFSATEEDLSEDEFVAKASRPSLPKKKSISSTPKGSMCKKRVMTPRIPERKIQLQDSMSPLQEAQLRLHVAAVPDNLPCRENEFAEIFSFTEAKVQDGIGGCMYISGVPGTGKTATVREVMRQLNAMVEDGDLPQFDFIEINGMRLTEPNQAYVHIWKAMNNGEKVTSEHAKNLLEKRFTGQEEKRVSPNRKMTVLLVDELDMLWNRKQSVLYNIFEWPTHKAAKLVVLAIANTMDLPERVMINRVSSRVGLTRLTFSPYNHQQLQEIVVARLSGLTVFEKDAIQLVARKVASLSGDARRALDICRRAAELAQRDIANHNVASPTKGASMSTKKGAKNLKALIPSYLVQLKHVTLAHQEMFCSPKILAIRHCSQFEKMFLRCLVSIFHQTGIEETNLVRVYRMTNEFATFEGKFSLTEPEFHAMVGRLAASRLILIEPGKCGRLDMKIRLNISQDDVTFALQEQNYGEE